MNDRITPPHLEELFSATQIATRIETLASVLDTWAEEAEAKRGHPLLAVCILRGGVFFFAETLLRMKRSVEPAFCRASSYARTHNGQPERDIALDLHGTDARERDVVLFDNICDSGRTFAVAAERLIADRARSVRSVACVHRIRNDSLHTPDLAAFTYTGPEWLAGYGLRDQDRGMNFPAIYRVKITQSSPTPAAGAKPHEHA